MKLITRSQWGARRANGVNHGSLSQASTGHWNGPTVSVRGSANFDHGYCAALVRGIQNFHMDGRGWNDIAYNFVICPHGHVFEGRGLNVRNGANGTNHGNKTSHAVMWLCGAGNAFVTAQKAAFRDCVKYISEKTAAPYAAVGHRDHKSTECPGNERYNWIKGGMKLSGGSMPSAPKDEEFVMDADAKARFDKQDRVLERLEKFHPALLGGRLRDNDNQYGQVGARYDIVWWLGEAVTILREVSVDRISAAVSTSLAGREDVSESMVKDAVKGALRDILSEMAEASDEVDVNELLAEVSED